MASPSIDGSRKTSQELKCQAASCSVFAAYCGQAVASS
jgi:hypothetical protein